MHVFVSFLINTFTVANGDADAYQPHGERIDLVAPGVRVAQPPDGIGIQPPVAARGSLPACKGACVL